MTKKENLRAVPIGPQGLAIPFKVGGTPGNPKALITAANHHLVGVGDGGWERREGQIKMGVAIQEDDTATQESRRLLAASRSLTGNARENLEKRLASFLYVKSQLHNYLKTPRGNVSTKVEGTELQNLWHNYLTTGRELIDEVGRVIHVCFGLNNSHRLNGFNEKKAKKLRNLILQERSRVAELDDLEKILDKYELIVLDFISLRNQEKETKDTIQDAPWISPDGDPSGGQLLIRKAANDRQNREFVAFFSLSGGALCEFTQKIATYPEPEDAHPSAT